MVDPAQRLAHALRQVFDLQDLARMLRDVGDLGLTYEDGDVWDRFEDVLLVAVADSNPGTTGDTE